jgi:arabinoxylan arabinofuranohydrolase
MGGPPGGQGQVNNAGSPWVTFWGDNSFIETAFDYAAKYRDDYLPDMKLFYNDYNEYLGLQNGKHAAMKALGKELFAKGTLDGIGMQSHVGDAAYYSRNDFLSAMDSFLEIGCEVQLTELDVTGNNTGTWYKEIFQHAVEKSEETNLLTAVVIWGSKQDLSWISSNGSNVVLFNADGSPNVNYNSISGDSIVPSSQWGDGDNPKGAGPPPPPPEPDENGYFFYDTFEEEEGSWGPRGEGTATAIGNESFEGSKSLFVSGRTDTWMGASKNLNSRAFVPGGTYAFGGTVMADVATNWQMSVYYVLSGEDVYATIDTASSAAGEWAILEGTLEIPTGATGALFYFETEYTAEDETLTANLTDFYLDEAYGGIEGATSPFENVEPPVTDPPATDPTDPPATDPPATDPPVTDPPRTNPPATNPPQGGVEMERAGDVDDNSKVEMADIVILCQAVAAEDVDDVLGPQGRANADVLADGIIDSADISVFATAMVNSELETLPKQL